MENSKNCFYLAFLLLTVTVGCSSFSFKEKPLDRCIRKRLEDNPTEGDENFINLGPNLVVNNFQGLVEPEVEQYVLLQIRLEEIAEESGLYRAPQNETDAILQKLHESQEVQDVIEKCNEYHTVPKCTSTQYRSIDGSCNNLKHPLWGTADSFVDRFVPASYNGVSGLRKSISGEDLPNVRSISINFENDDVPSTQVSAFYSYFGQVLVHDFSLGPGITRNGTLIPCCVENPDSNCEDIKISSDDPFYRHFNFSCIQFARTAPFPKCDFGKRLQMNKKTAFLDLSLIYGSNDKEAQQMRSKDSSGRLNTRQTPFGEILPNAHSDKTLFCPKSNIERCFLSGDERVNQHTMLTSMQVLLVRLHNIIHDQLHGLNPHWDNEKLYQESRRIIIALYQNTIYQEYLPWLVGPENMNKYNLSIDCEDSLYDEETRPFLFNEFNTASFRLHSMVPKAVSTYYPDIRMRLLYSYFCPVYRGQLDAYVTGSCEAASEKFDRFLKEDVRDYMNSPPKSAFGVDIGAINIQRGRDHGLGIYIDVVEKCSEGKTRIETFSDLKNLMSEDSVEIVEKIYSDVRDIDLWVGMIMENPIEGGITGPTSTCVSAIQFHRLKFGDSFFYTHKNGRYPFTADQLENIKSYTLARWLCDTTTSESVRRYPLAVPWNNNPVTACQALQPLDLSLWREDL